MAHIQKRTYTSRRTGKKTVAWQARYTAPDGRERTKRFERQVDAQHWLNTNGADIARGAWIDPKLGEVTFREYAERWLETKVDVAPRTKINITGRLKNHTYPHIGSTPMASARHSDVRALVASLIAQRKAASTVKAAYLTTSQVFEQAVLDCIIARNPCNGVKLPRDVHHEEKHFLTADQVRHLADAIDDRYRSLIYTAAFTGLRAGELVALKVDSLDILGRSLAVTGAASEVRGKLRFGPTKTGRSRVVTLPPFLAQMLGEHIGRYPSTGGYVFTAREGGPIHHRNFYRRHFRPAVSKARRDAIEEGRAEDALPRTLRFHDLRHTCAAILIADGRHMQEVKDQLGHGSIRVTSDRYGHLFPAARQSIADGLEAAYQSSTRAGTDKGRTKSRIVPFPDAKEGAI